MLMGGVLASIGTGSLKWVWSEVKIFICINANIVNQNTPSIILSNLK